MVVGCQPYAPAAFTPRNILGTHFHYGLSRPQGRGLVGRKYVTEKSSDNTGTVRLVAQRLNHYATPGPNLYSIKHLHYNHVSWSTILTFRKNNDLLLPLQGTQMKIASSKNNSAMQQN